MDQQTKLVEETISENSPKFHRLIKKKFYAKNYPVEARDFEGIIKEAEDLGREHFIVAYSGGKDSGKI